MTSLSVFGTNTTPLYAIYEQSSPGQSFSSKSATVKARGATLNNISQIYDAKGDYDMALRYLEQSLAIHQQIGDRIGEGATLNNISQIYNAKGDYDTALRYLEQSLAINRQIGDRKGEGATLNNISQIHMPKATTTPPCAIWNKVWPFSSKSATVKARARL